MTILPDTMPICSNNDIEQTYRSAYIVAGIEALQRVWVARGYQESIDELVKIASSMQDK